jgi:4'-phosphopantetheinyl transferase
MCKQYAVVNHMDSLDQQLTVTVTELSGDCVLDPSAPQLSVSSIHIWQFPLTISTASLDHFTAMLSEDERARAARFRFEKDTRHFTVARAMVRSILGSYLKIPGRNLRFVYSHHGKPALADDTTDIRFSVSHSSDLGMLAVTRGREVGVDLETTRDNVEIDQLAIRYFSEHECAALREISNTQRLRAFFRCWTSKEAFLKAQGIGLSRSLGSFDVEVNPKLPARLLATRPNAEEAEHWSLHDVPTEENYASAVAWEGSIGEIKLLCCR